MDQDRTRIVAGCMTGTSLDGLDVALVKITGTGLDMKAELLGHLAVSFEDALRNTLMSLASGEANEPLVYMRAARALGEMHAEALGQLFVQAGETNVDFVTAHGQTIWHAPRDKQGPKSWQLFDPWPLVKRLKLPVCYDLRQADLIAGGEGAPLTPIADWVMYRSESKCVIVNLGGVCNVSVLPGVNSEWEITGRDIGPCNLLLDALVQRLFPEEKYDKDGVISSKGSFSDDIKMPIDTKRFDRSDWPMSAGREQYDTEWLESLLDWATEPVHGRNLSNAELVSAAIDAVAFDVVVSYIIRLNGFKQIVLAGGGAKNPNLVMRIRERFAQCIHEGGKIILSDDLGIPCEAREAMGFAVLGALSQDGVPISLPQVTGATDPGVAGVWAYP